MNFTAIEYDNGIKAILGRNNSPVVHSALIVGAGTRNEQPHEHGAAHLMEHMFFKGTTKRKPYHINSLLENVGGELNAYTTKEETTVHASTLKTDINKAFDLITDIVFNSIIKESELEKEKSVVIDEINSYKDSPSELIFDDFEEMVFANSSLGRNILGTKKSLNKLTSLTLKGFTERCYNTDRMVFGVVGNISEKRFRYLCDKYLKDIPSRINDYKLSPLEPYHISHKSINKNTFQTHCIMGSRAYDHSSDKRIILGLLNNLLGGATSSSKLNMALREKNGLSYNVECNYSSYADSGINSIYFGCDNINFDKCIELVNKELYNVRTNLLSTNTIFKTKKQLLGQLAISMESYESVMLSAIKSYLVFKEIDTLEILQKKIESITATQIMDVANEIYNPENLSYLIYK